MDIVFVEALEVDVTTGVHDWERQLSQRLRIDLVLGWDATAAGRSDALNDALDYAAVSERVQDLGKNSDYYLLETLAEVLAERLRSEFSVPWLRLTLTKPGAVPGARAAGLTIERGEAGGA